MVPEVIVEPERKHFQLSSQRWPAERDDALRVLIHRQEEAAILSNPFIQVANKVPECFS